MIVEHTVFVGAVKGEKLPTPAGSLFQTRVPMCHKKPHRVLWDFSQCNLDYYKTSLPNVSDSTMIIPIMFHDRFEKHYYNNTSQLVPLFNRGLDFPVWGPLRKFLSRTEDSSFGTP